VRALERAAPLRRALARRLERRLREGHKRDVERAWQPPGVSDDKLALSLAVLQTVERSLEEHRLGDASVAGFLGRLVHDILLRRGDKSAKQAFRDRHGCGPPDFLVISPGKACNLRCTGCYAGSGPHPEKLGFPTLDRLVSEAHDQWGMRFFVLSGGEPLAYRDEGRGVLDLARRHPDCFFIMYTNGTLVDDEVAGRMGELGNLSPALSIEGLRERTDERRGRGVFDKVLVAISRLRREKVLFGVSLTATRKNADEILADELVDLFFDELGAFYAWIFQYMPMGRGATLDLMVSPEQRLRMWERMWSLVRERRIFMVDFWNSGTATFGCVAAGRPGGYLHVNWNGDVSPCVFVPYSPVNIRATHAQGRTLDDVWAEPFFASIRGWQRSYGYREKGEGRDGYGNWLAPCIIRDHHQEFRQILARHPATPVDEDARAALLDPHYQQGLESFGDELASLSRPIWESRYFGLEPPTHRPVSPRRGS
jgi:MoaA/NifB/PqqE/SkfB family radical SAM enzyme